MRWSGSRFKSKKTPMVTVLAEEVEKEAAKSLMVYLKSERSLDLSKMKATDYKYNRHIFLPKHESTEREKH